MEHCFAFPATASSQRPEFGLRQLPKTVLPCRLVPAIARLLVIASVLGASSAAMEELAMLLAEAPSALLEELDLVADSFVVEACLLRL